MTEDEMKAWIDTASYEDLLRRWRQEPFGSPWFSGDIGDYFLRVMDRKADELSALDVFRASKEVGW